MSIHLNECIFTVMKPVSALLIVYFLVYVMKSKKYKNYTGFYHVFGKQEALGTDFMVNFSTVRRAEISARLIEQIFLKRLSQPGAKIN